MLNKKLTLLCDNNSRVANNAPIFIPDFVINESNETFSENELAFLNKGLKFAPKNTKTPFVDIVVDIESTLKYKLPSIQSDVRGKVSKTPDSVPAGGPSNAEKQQFRAIKSLKEKSVCYVKADKSNNVVVLNKNDYDERVSELIKECKYTETNKNPLKQMVRESNKLRQRIKTLFGERISRS